MELGHHAGISGREARLDRRHDALTGIDDFARTSSSGQIGKSPSNDFIIASWNTNSSIPRIIAAMPCGVRLTGASAVVAIVLNSKSSLRVPAWRSARWGGY